MYGKVTSSRDAGFTLIELMIVVTVLALLTISVSFSANRPRSANASDAARFQATYDRLREQAVLSRQVLGLTVSDKGYQGLRWSGGKWAEIGNLVPWRGDVAILQPFDPRAPLQFAPSGQSIPVQMRFDAREGVPVCRGDGWTGVTCSAG